MRVLIFKVVGVAQSVMGCFFDKKAHFLWEMACFINFEYVLLDLFALCLIYTRVAGDIGSQVSWASRVFVLC